MGAFFLPYRSEAKVLIMNSPIRPTLQFWFEFASTYSYLSALRIDDIARTFSFTVEWKPFLLGPLFKDFGWNDSPFNLYPIKGDYMWKDVKRRADKYGFEFRRPTVFPRSGLQAARIAKVGLKQGWGTEFVKRVFQANFAEDQNIQELEVLESLLEMMGLEAGPIVEEAQSETVKRGLKEQTEEAKILRIFGAPTFVVNGELFWGDDRLEDAVAALFSKKSS